MSRSGIPTAQVTRLSTETSRRTRPEAAAVSRSPMHQSNKRPNVTAGPTSTAVAAVIADTHQHPAVTAGPGLTEDDVLTAVLDTGPGRRR